MTAITNTNSDVDIKLFGILTKYFDAKREFLNEFKLNLVYDLEDMTKYYWKYDLDSIICYDSNDTDSTDFSYEFTRHGTALSTESYSIIRVVDVFQDICYALFDNSKFIS